MEQFYDIIREIIQVKVQYKPRVQFKPCANFTWAEVSEYGIPNTIGTVKPKISRYWACNNR